MEIRETQNGARTLYTLCKGKTVLYCSEIRDEVETEWYQETELKLKRYQETKSPSLSLFMRVKGWFLSKF